VSVDVNYRSTLAPADVAGPLLRKIAEAAERRHSVRAVRALLNAIQHVERRRNRKA
jgi:hypothetical protein